MRIVKMLMLAVLAVVVHATGAVGQEAPTGHGSAPPADTTLAPAIDRRLLVSVAEQRAAVARYGDGVELVVPEWNLYDAVEYMAWGMLPGMVVGLVVGGATADDDLTALGSIYMGSIIGGLIGGGAGIAVYTIPRL